MGDMNVSDKWVVAILFIVVGYFLYDFFKFNFVSRTDDGKRDRINLLRLSNENTELKRRLNLAEKRIVDLSCATVAAVLPKLNGVKYGDGVSYHLGGVRIVNECVSNSRNNYRLRIVNGVVFLQLFVDGEMHETVLDQVASGAITAWLNESYSN